MRKRALKPPGTPADEWLDLESLAEVEITSEDAAHPIEAALLPGESTGWRAAEAGDQSVRLVFDAPQSLRRIQLVFRETSAERTQEYSLRWSADGRDFQEIVRQQWNFSPSGATEQVEDHHVTLDGVRVLELTIAPDLSGGSSPASLETLRLA